MDIIEKLQKLATRSNGIGADDALRLFEEGAARAGRREQEVVKISKGE